jgi:ribosomal-protein-serine acetyltransferase
MQVDPYTELRPIQMADAPEFFQLIDRNRAYLREWLGWVDGMGTVADLEKFIAMRIHLASEKSDLCFLIWHQKRMAGILHLVGIDAQNRRAVIGYWIGQQFRGQGIVKRATTKLVDYAFTELHLNLNRLEIRCATGNRASQAIPRALGFKEEGLLRDNEWLYDHFVDHVVFSMLKRDWQLQERKGVADSPPDENQPRSSPTNPLSPLIFREIDPANFEEVYEFNLQHEYSWRDSSPSYIADSEEDRRKKTEKMIEILNNKSQKYHCLAVFDGKQMIASHFLDRYEIEKRSACHVHGLWVQADYRKRGVAQKLKELGEAWARQQKCVFMDSNVRATNPEMIALNQKLGYELVRHNFRKNL